jgi:hypothetical protein
MENSRVLKSLTNSSTVSFRSANVPTIRIRGSAENNEKESEENVAPSSGITPFNQLTERQKRRRMAIIRAEIEKLNRLLRSKYGVSIKFVDLVPCDPNDPRDDVKISFVDNK